MPPAVREDPQVVYVQRTLKDRSVAIILEIVGGLFGLFGIGWIYSGNTGLGVGLLLGGLMWGLASLVLVALTGGFGCLCTIPMSLAGAGISTYFLNEYTKQHPELFGP